MLVGTVDVKRHCCGRSCCSTIRAGPCNVQPSLVLIATGPPGGPNNPFVQLLLMKILVTQTQTFTDEVMVLKLYLLFMTSLSWKCCDLIKSLI